MTKQEQIQNSWNALVANLDHTKWLLHVLASGIARLQELGFKAEWIRDAKAEADKEFLNKLGMENSNDAEEAKPNENREGVSNGEDLQMKQIVVHMILKETNELRRNLHSSLFRLKETLKQTPFEVLQPLDELRGSRWRAGLLRFYVDRVRILPGPVMPPGSDFDGPDSVQAIYHKMDLICPLHIFLDRFEQHDAFKTWGVYERTAESYLADLHSIRLEIGTDSLEGPVEPDSWRHEGKIYSGLKPTAWKLVNLLWSKPDYRASFDDIAIPVFGDEKAVVTQTRLGSHRKSANSFFGENSIPYSVRLSNDTALLVEDSPESRHA